MPTKRELANPNYPGRPFTDFASVTPDTPLESLNLNWRERDPMLEQDLRSSTRGFPSV